MKIIFFTAAFICFLVFVLPALLAFGIRNTPDRFQPSLDRTQQIYTKVSLSQSFFSTKDGLSIIGLSIKNPNLQNKKDITLSIFDSNNIQLRTAVINGKSIGDGDFVKFKFDPIPDSKNKEFTFSLDSPSSSQNESLEVFLTKQKIQNVDQLKVSTIKIDTEEASMSASFVPYYKVKSWPALVLTIYRNWMQKFLADKIFAIVYFGILIILGIILLSRFRPDYWRKSV